MNIVEPTTDSEPTGPSNPPTPPAPPSVHVRALLTWLAIFPLVAIGLMATAPLMADWHPVLRAFVLTAVIVPLAVYVIMPRLLALYARLRNRG